MKKGWLICLMISSLMILAGCQSGKSSLIEPGNSANPSMVSRSELAHVLATEPNDQAKLSGMLVSGVLPHHLLAAPLITSFLYTLSIQQPSLIILVGPNHPNQGAKIITGLNDWQTPEGRMETEQSIVNKLLQQGLAIRDENTIANEHSIASLIPIVHHYLPSAKVVPIILQHEVSLAEVDKLLNALQPFINKDGVVLASVDFSHYLTRPQAQTKDNLTLKYMQNFDYTTLFSLDSDYLDSPAALACAFRHAQQQGVTRFQVLANTNSGVIMRNDTMATTSYFTLVFTH
ncbi:MAG: AmmeMemoRadiSam system protein B [Methylocystaceae bacterium]